MHLHGNYLTFLSFRSSVHSLLFIAAYILTDDCLWLYLNPVPVLLSVRNMGFRGFSEEQFHGHWGGPWWLLWHGQCMSRWWLVLGWSLEGENCLKACRRATVFKTEDRDEWTRRGFQQAAEQRLSETCEEEEHRIFLACMTNRDITRELWRILLHKACFARILMAEVQTSLCCNTVDKIFQTNSYW